MAKIKGLLIQEVPWRALLARHKDSDPLLLASQYCPWDSGVPVPAVCFRELSSIPSPSSLSQLFFSKAMSNAQTAF